MRLDFSVTVQGRCVFGFMVKVFGFMVKSKQRRVDIWLFYVTFEELCEIEQMKTKEKNGKRILKILSQYFFLGKYIQSQWLWTAVTEQGSSC